MRRDGGLRRRLLAGIGMLTVLFVGVLVVMLVAIGELRETDRGTRQMVIVVTAASAARDAAGTFVRTDRDARDGDTAAERALAAALVAVRRRLGELEDTLDGRDDDVAQALRNQISTLRSLFDDVSDPALARSGRVELDRHIELATVELGGLIDRERASIAERRERTSALSKLAQFVGIAGIVATLLLVAGCVIYVRRWVLTPLRRISDAARSLDAGDLHARVAFDRGNSGEVAELGRAFDQMAASLEENRAALQRQNAELESREAELVDAVRSAREGASVLRAVLDATPDAIALLDRDGAAIVDNPPMRAVRSAFGERATAVDLDGTLVPLDVGAGGHEIEETRDEIMLLGSRRSFARYAAPVRDSQGRVIGRLLVLREVTRERAAERVKEEFFALVSHELRTPLTAILGYVELVLGEEDDSIDEEQIRYLEIVERNAQRLLRLVGDLLFAAQVESGTLLLEPGTIDLPQIAREAVEAARPRAEDSDIALSAKIDPLPPCMGDRDRIAQVLDNLISNALKFTHAGGQVRVRLAAVEETAWLEVSDTGVGIPADEHARLFDRFFRASNATARAVPGVGLGLMIVRTIVAAHGGTIEVDSEIGVGTTFTVRLPLHAAPPADAADGPLPLVAYRDEPSSSEGRYR